MRKLDEILSGSNRENRPAPMTDPELTDPEPTIMQGPNRDQERVLSLTLESEQRQPRRGRAGRIRSRQKRMRQRGHVYRQCRKSDQYQILLLSRKTRRYTLQYLSL